ncbi:hypothetical protein ACLB2K_046846 [Fragaria x ananassa]
MNLLRGRIVEYYIRESIVVETQLSHARTLRVKGTLACEVLATKALFTKREVAASMIHLQTVPVVEQTVPVVEQTADEPPWPQLHWPMLLTASAGGILTAILICRLLK